MVKCICSNICHSIFNRYRSNFFLLCNPWCTPFHIRFIKVRHLPISFDSQSIGRICGIVIVLGQIVGNIVATISTLNNFSIFRPRRYGIYWQNGQHHTEGQYHAEQSFFHKNPPFCKNPKYSSLHPPQTQKAPHRPNGWYDALRFVLWGPTALEVMPMCGMV